MGDAQSLILSFDPNNCLPYGRAITLSPRQEAPVHKAIFGHSGSLYVVSDKVTYEVALSSEEVIEKAGGNVDGWVQGEVVVLTGAKTVAYLGYSKGTVVTMEVGDEVSKVAERCMSSVFI